MNEKIQRLSDLIKVFGSWSKAQEILFLLHGLKEVVRHGFYDFELKAVEEFCSANNIFLAKSPFKIILNENKEINQKFSNLGLKSPDLSDNKGMSMIYLSKDEKKAHLAVYYEQTNNQKELGLLLGYPSCCVDYFCQNFSASNNNPEIASDNIFTNLAHREEDCVLISHFPCKADCSESIKIGKDNLELLQKIESERAKVALNVLKNTDNLQ
ncbi:DUF483 domain-containing protein [Candidatus Woesearchaeota archaeon]|nr:DUF483 domain-containing protein [Candidatus Woesearchaeota archaeon]